ncbi:MAG: copper chaperone PCu(A)C [Gammaproteobacteria bacterium]|nr:copper chaperone PCu(A)C [Gammaproteobacteria bacterium]
MGRLPRFLCRLLILQFLLVEVAFTAGLVISGARINESPPTIQVMAGYMTISNPTADDIEIRSLSSPGFERVEIHETRMENDVARMVRQESLVVEAGTSVNLEPGGRHIMFMDPEKPLRAGDRVTLFMQLSDGSEVQQEMNVVRSGGNHDHSHHH